jgi:hypothetical protein
MEVSAQQLHRIGTTLHDLAAQLRSACSGELSGPADPAWATDTALAALARVWDGYLCGLAGRLDSAGDGLISAAAGYRASDERATVRYGRLLC